MPIFDEGNCQKARADDHPGTATVGGKLTVSVEEPTTPMTLPEPRFPESPQGLPGTTQSTADLSTPPTPGPPRPPTPPPPPPLPLPSVLIPANFMSPMVSRVTSVSEVHLRQVTEASTPVGRSIATRLLAVPEPESGVGSPMSIDGSPEPSWSSHERLGSPESVSSQRSSAEKRASMLASQDLSRPSTAVLAELVVAAASIAATSQQSLGGNRPPAARGRVVSRSHDGSMALYPLGSSPLDAGRAAAAGRHARPTSASIVPTGRRTTSSNLRPVPRPVADIKASLSMAALSPQDASAAMLPRAPIRPALRVPRPAPTAAPAVVGGSMIFPGGCGSGGWPGLTSRGYNSRLGNLPDLGPELPVCRTAALEDLVQCVVWEVGCRFGFQMFNVNPQTSGQPTKEWVPATVFVAGDHLVRLLLRNALPRRAAAAPLPEPFSNSNTDAGESGGSKARSGASQEQLDFALCVFELHSTFFFGFESQWAPLVGLSVRTEAQQDVLREQDFHSSEVVHGLLCELALFLLMWSEAANMRHVPEGLWFLFWCLKHSPAMDEMWAAGKPPATPQGARARRPQLRNALQADILMAQGACQHDPSRCAPGKVATRVLPVLRHHLMVQLTALSPVSVDDVELVARMAAWGDGGYFCDRIITPLFYFLSHEMDAMFEAGEDIAYRVGYDDMNESLCNRTLVHATLAHLGLRQEDLRDAGSNSAWDALCRLGCSPTTRSASRVTSGDGTGAGGGGHKLGGGPLPPLASESTRAGGNDVYEDDSFDAQVASNFWSSKAFVKTYLERRSWWALYRAFFRVYALQLVAVHLMIAQSFEPYDLDVLSSVVLSHAWLVALERFSNWVMTRRPANPLDRRHTASAWVTGKDSRVFKTRLRKRKSTVVPCGTDGTGGSAPGQQQDDPPEPLSPNSARRLRRTVLLEGAPIWGVFGFVEWVLLAVGLTMLYVVFVTGEGPLSGLVVGTRTFHEVMQEWWLLIAAMYTGVYVLHFLATTRDGHVISLTASLGLPRIFSCHSSRSAPTCWLYGDMSVSWSIFLVNMLLWLAILGVKWSAEYFLICKPLVGPIRAIMRRKWLGCMTEPLQRLNPAVPCISGDWMLLAVRMLPLVLTCLIDTAVFYQVALSIFGLLRGMLRLDLGVVASWDELLKEFHKGPIRWWSKCVSDLGAQNQQRQVERVMLGVEPLVAAPGQPLRSTASMSTPPGRRRRQSSTTTALTATAAAQPSAEVLISPASLAPQSPSLAQRAGSGAVRMPGSHPRRTSFRLTSTYMDDNSDDGENEGASPQDDGGHHTRDQRLAVGRPVAKGSNRSRRRSAGRLAWSEGLDATGRTESVALMALMAHRQTSLEQQAAWSVFATVWDAIVDDMRNCDLVTNMEAENLRFLRLENAADFGALRPLLLPVFSYAGQVQLLVDTGHASNAQLVILAELRSLLTWLGCELGLLSTLQAHVLLSTVLLKNTSNVEHQDARTKMHRAAVRLVVQLDKMCTGNAGAKGEAISALGEVVKGLGVEANALRRAAKQGIVKKRKVQAADDLADVVAQIQVDMLSNQQLLDDCFKMLLPHPEPAFSCPVTPKTPVRGPRFGEPGSWSPQAMSSHTFRRQVVRVLFKMLTTPKAAATPKGEEARRILGFFMNSLGNPQMSERPPAAADMTSWTVLTPVYEEDVLYPLEGRALAPQLNLPASAAAGAKPGDLLTETEDEVSLMAYLRSVFPEDWENFKERLGEQLGGADLRSVTEADFAEGQPLHAVRLELELWATYRGQLLGRTIKGMMCYERAVQLLAQVEHPQPAGVSDEDYRRWLMRVVGSKFDYVCSCQMYGKFRSAPDIKRRWLTASVDIMLRQHPTLSVAFIDSAPSERGGVADNFSVLIQSDAPGATVLAGPTAEPDVRTGARRRRASMAWALATGGRHVLEAADEADELAAAAPAEAVWDTRAEEHNMTGAFESPRGLHTGNRDSSEGSEEGESLLDRLNATPTDRRAVEEDQRRQRASSMAAAAAVAEAVASMGAEAEVDLEMPAPIREVYRVRLPSNRFTHRGVLVGEGKPENQNHAVIFCFGEALQTIDMNQDNYLAEALKMRNMLMELRPTPAKSDHGSGSPSLQMTGAQLKVAIIRRKREEHPTALVGFREWIFSDVSGALGAFAASAELAFGTIVQRTMSYPGRVRMHYGHPDVFNKLHSMTRGGISKATRQLHISEDIFGGYNHSLRGGQIQYSEFMAVGKGRDMGFDTINAFEIKISGGGGECVLSRDIQRISARQDIFRLLHCYYSGIGYYANAYLLMVVVYYQAVALLLFALARASQVTKATAGGGISFEQTLSIGGLVQLGMLSLLPYVAQLFLESGFFKALSITAGQILSGAFGFFAFKQQTTAFSFSDDMTYGGARYMSTGRGFSITSSDFVKLYGNYARSHTYLGFDLCQMLIVYAIVKDCASCSYGAETWGIWLVGISLVIAPFWFNPMTFNIVKVKRDYQLWRAWMAGEMDASTGSSWYTWNREQLKKIRNERGNQQGRATTVVTLLVAECVPPLLLAVAAVSRLDYNPNAGGPKLLQSNYLIFAIATAVIWGLVLLTAVLRRRFSERAKGRVWRICRILLALLFLAATIAYFVYAVRWFKGAPLRNLFLVLYANLLLLHTAHRGLMYLAPTVPACCMLVDKGFWAVDLVVGGVLLLLLALLSLIGIVAHLQAVLLFSPTFAQSVRRGQLVRTVGMHKTEGAQRQEELVRELSTKQAQKRGRNGTARRRL